MNRFGKWWDDSITIYNKYENPITNVVLWYKTTLNNCFWKNSNNKVSLGETIIESNNIICRIPKNSKFLTHSQWINLPNDKMQKRFTLGIGDIVVKGKVNDEIDEYTKGKHSTDLIDKYKENKECMIIENISENIGNRGLEHYSISGK